MLLLRRRRRRPCLLGGGAEDGDDGRSGGNATRREKTKIDNRIQSIVAVVGLVCVCVRVVFYDYFFFALPRRRRPAARLSVRSRPGMRAHTISSPPPPRNVNRILSCTPCRRRRRRRHEVALPSPTARPLTGTAGADDNHTRARDGPSAAAAATVTHRRRRPPPCVAATHFYTHTHTIVVCSRSPPPPPPPRTLYNTHTRTL